MEERVKRKINAYFSVEAALILPLAIGVILLTVCAFVFQYDRCLLEQDMGALALRGSMTEADTEEELSQKLQAQAAELYRDKYVAWDFIAMEIKRKRETVEVMGKGKLRISLGELNLWNKDNLWETNVSYKFRRISPVSFIRNVEKLKGGE